MKEGRERGKEGWNGKKKEIKNVALESMNS